MRVIRESNGLRVMERERENEQEREREVKREVKREGDKVEKTATR